MMVSSHPPFAKILIANRGEIAVRIARTCHELGIRVVAVYSDADGTALHVRVADEAYRIGPPPARESYLNIDAILAAAKESGAEAIHPGYGFLSENPEFAERVIAAGLVFVGPPAGAIRAMGDKAAAKRLMVEAGVPVVPGYQGEDQSDERLRAEAERVGYPLLIKASAGGGGRGMREVREPLQFLEQLAGARREALAAFADDRMLLERLVEQAHHVEVQVFGDQLGNVVYLGERDCSVQRRHQKVIEESPSPVVDAELRQQMGEAAVRAAARVGYTNAGTVEFLLAPSGEFFFLEMNTRLQVEHPVTEATTGLDLVKLQLDVAAGKPLPFDQPQVLLQGHAIEVRLYAEDPLRNFLPSAGRLTAYRMPAGDGVRVDDGYTEGGTVSPYYDAMLAKIISRGADREEAIERLSKALGLTAVGGVATNLALLRSVIAAPEFQAGQATTGFLEANWPALANGRGRSLDAALGTAGFLLTDTSRVANVRADPWRALGPWRAGTAERLLPLVIDGEEVMITAVPADGHAAWRLEIDGKVEQVAYDRISDTELILRHAGDAILCTRLSGTNGDAILRLRSAEHAVGLARPKSPDAAAAGVQIGGGGQLTAPLPGVIVKLNVQEGDSVKARQTLVVLEAMKMEHAIQATINGRVKRVSCREGDRVTSGAVLIELEPAANE